MEGQLLMAATYKPRFISRPAVVQSLLYSGHTIWQKNIFICFPGGSHNGLYLFNKVNPYKLQRLHWGCGGGVEDTLLVFSDLEWWMSRLLAWFFYHGATPFITQCVLMRAYSIYCSMTSLVCFLFHFPLLPGQHFSKYIICPLRLAEGGHGMQFAQLTTMALSLIAYFLE